MKKIYVGMWLSVIAIFVVSGCRKEARNVPGADITSKAQTDSTGCIYKDTLKLNNKSGSRVLVYKQLVNRAVDATGRVEIAVWRSINEGQHVTAQVSMRPTRRTSPVSSMFSARKMSHTNVSGSAAKDRRRLFINDVFSKALLKSFFCK
jgi:hypothetical protein